MKRGITRSLTITLPATLVLVALAALLPSVALAAWVRADARIVDPYGTGYASLLNVQVRTSAENDAAAVTEVQFSEDGAEWYGVPYTGSLQPWVLSGESGQKTLLVRFAGADGSVSPVIPTGIIVDTAPPRTVACGAVHCARGARATFRFTTQDPVSPRVQAELVISRAGRTVKVARLGWLATGPGSAALRVRLPRGSYTWKVRAMDLAHWAEERATAGRLLVR